MLRTILTYGVVAGLLVGVPLFITAVTMKDEPPAYGMVIGYLTMLVALSTIFVAIKRRRDRDGGGVIRFWPAFGLGIAITAVAGVFYVAAWEAGMAIAGGDFGMMYTDMMLRQATERGASAAELAALSAQMAEFREDYADPLFRLPMSFAEIFPVGILVSLVSAALLRNSRFLPARAAIA